MNAYKAVYGEAGKRSDAQNKVWDSMMLQLMTPARDVDPITIQTNEGMRQYIWNIKQMVECGRNRAYLEKLWLQLSH